MVFGKKFDLSTIEQYLKKKGWKYMRVSEDTLITGISTPTNRFYLIFIRFISQNKTILFHFQPLRIQVDILQALLTRSGFFRVHIKEGHSPEKVAQVCEVITHWNYTTILGSLDRDYTDGEIRYRAAFPYRDGEFTFEQFNWFIDVSLVTLDNALPKLEALIEGRISVEEALGVQLKKPEGPIRV